jgi:type VI secretion system secreted protein Hcp
VAADYFLQFSNPIGGPATKIPAGESKDAAHVGWVGISDFSFGETNPITIGSSSGGAGAGKVKFNEFQITKSVDSTSPALFQLAAAGAHMPTVVLAIRKAAGATVSPADYLKFEFHLVFVSSIAWSGGGGEAPVESVTFAYGSLGMAYHTQSSTGALSASPLVGTWSQITNTATDPTIPFTHLT